MRSTAPLTPLYTYALSPRSTHTLYRDCLMTMCFSWELVQRGRVSARAVVLRAVVLAACLLAARAVQGDRRRAEQPDAEPRHGVTRHLGVVDLADELLQCLPC